MFGRAIGTGFCIARDAVAKVLIAAKVTPNKLTLTGTSITLAAGICYAIGAGKGFAASFDIHGADNIYPVLAASLLILSCACDMLDGAVARIGQLKTRFGAFLDSTLDRFSDFAIFAGIAIYYVWTSSNVTFVLLAMLAFFGGFMISYTRARAEDLIESCSVGYWQRGERMAAVLIATFAHNMPALLLQQGLLPLLTGLRRILYTKAIIDGKTPLDDPRKGSLWLKIRLWRWPRMTWAYDLVTGLNIAFLIFARFNEFDPIGAALR